MKADSEMSLHAMHAAVMDPTRFDALSLHEIDPKAYENGFVVMGILRVCTIPEVLAVISTAIPTTVENANEFSERSLFQQLEKMLGKPVLNRSSNEK